MEYYLVSYYVTDTDEWRECGRFYKNALIIDYNLIFGKRYWPIEGKTRPKELTFAAHLPRFQRLTYDADWVDAPGSYNWPQFENKNYPIVGMYEHDPRQDVRFRLEPPDVRPVKIIAYAHRTQQEGEVFRDDSPLYYWKSWDHPMTLSNLFDVFPDSINVKDISR